LSILLLYFELGQKSAASTITQSLSCRQWTGVDLVRVRVLSVSRVESMSAHDSADGAMLLPATSPDCPGGVGPPGMNGCGSQHQSQGGNGVSDEYFLIDVIL
jgi:hypothetical protein